MEAITKAAQDVLAERLRQVEQEGWTPDHDDQHTTGELADAASCYAYASNADASVYPAGNPPLHHWPWEPEWWKPCDQRRMLVKAGALILAEIERLDRASAHERPTDAEYEAHVETMQRRAEFDAEMRRDAFGE